MLTNSLPLLELFTRLRDSGMPLGIDEYQLALKAMSKGFGVGDRAALLRLCETLWTKTEEEKQRLAYHFEQLMPLEQSRLTAPQTPLQTIEVFPARTILIAFALCLSVVAGAGGIIWYMNWGQPTSTKASVPESQETQQSNLAETSEELVDEEIALWIRLFLVGFITSPVGLLTAVLLINWLSKQPSSTTPKLFSDVFSTGMQAVNDEIEATKDNQNSTQSGQNPFIITDQYLPITQRQMKQSWRYLYQPIREGNPTQLDVKATIQQIGQQGIFLSPIFVPPRTNRATLLLLIDRDGSMCPVHKLTDCLVTTAQRGGRFGMTCTYYFHNCPIGYLYHDSICLEEKSLDDIFSQLSMRQLSALIVSDAGASRQGYNPYRIKETQAFFDILFQRIRHVAWLNPMPRQRWTGTTAAEIAKMIPMFDCSRGGLDGAVDVLRGRKVGQN